MSLIPLGATVGLVMLAGAIQSHHADSEGNVETEDLISLYVRERTAELIGEGLDAASAHRQATSEAEEAVASVT